MNKNNQHYLWCNNSKFPLKLNPDWMKYINDNVYINELSIPGSHNSIAKHGLFFAECQSWSIYDQLLSGIRYLDLRIRLKQNEIHMYHGIIYQRQSFKDVVSKIKLFLKEYSSEGVIIRLREEEDPIDTDESITIKSQLENNFFNIDESLFLLKLEMPQMMEIRGKIWILTDNISLKTKRFRTVNLQDDYDYTFKFIKKKKKIIEDMIVLYNNTYNSNSEILINHCSAIGFPLNTPYTIAKKTNKVIYNYRISNNDNKKDIFGIVAMDFPGEGVIERIIHQNNISLK